MKRLFVILAAIALMGWQVAAAEDKGCLSCHEGIERFDDTAMSESIEAMGEGLGDPGGCVVCHGGTPSADTAEAAHAGPPISSMAAGLMRFTPILALSGLRINPAANAMTAMPSG